MPKGIPRSFLFDLGELSEGNLKFYTGLDETVYSLDISSYTTDLQYLWGFKFPVYDNITKVSNAYTLFAMIEQGTEPLKPLELLYGYLPDTVVYATDFLIDENKVINEIVQGDKEFQITLNANDLVIIENKPLISSMPALVTVNINSEIKMDGYVSLHFSNPLSLGRSNAQNRFKEIKMIKGIDNQEINISLDVFKAFGPLPSYSQCIWAFKTYSSSFSNMNGTLIVAAKKHPRFKAGANLAGIVVKK